MVILQIIHPLLKQMQAFVLFSLSTAVAIWSIWIGSFVSLSYIATSGMNIEVRVLMATSAVSAAKTFYPPIVKLSASENFDASEESLERLNPADSSKYPRTYIGSARFFADFYKNILRYVPERKQ